MTAKMAGRATISGVPSRVFGALVLVAGLGLAGCSDVDSMLFGDSGPEEQAAPATPEGEAPAPIPAPQPVVSSPSAAAPVATVAPVTIEPGSDTGTAVSKTIATLRSQVAGLQSSLTQHAQQLADLRNACADAATRYHESRARITTRLQVGTTRGNPELVAEWNRAQSALDSLAGDINQLNALGTAIAGDASTAHYDLDQMSATFNVSGAVDEDHRQLTVLEDETNQTIVLIDRLLSDVSQDIQRQTAFSANERANLTTLAGAIKAGELYGADLGSPMFASAAPARGPVAYAGSPLVVIRFDRENVDYQQILYAALAQALQSRPGASFSVVGVSPARGTVTAVQLAQTAARRHAEAVMRSMTDMGVPASRMTVASQTDPTAVSNEVRVYVR